MRGSEVSVRCLRGARLAERTAVLRAIQCDAASAAREIKPRDPYRTVTAVVGAHGGAGTTTIARLVHAPDAGTVWPGPDEHGFAVQVILAARTSAAGLMAASRALAGYCAGTHDGGRRLAGFVLTPDAPGRLPKELNRRISILASATMVFRMPWVNEWRLCEVTTVPRQDWPVLTGLRAYVQQATHGTAPTMSAHPRGD